MTIPCGNLHVRSWVGTLLVLALWAPIGVSGLARAQTSPAASLGAADPAAPLALTPAEKSAILNAVRQDNAKPDAKMPPNSPVAVGVQLPASIALRILPDAALAQAPAAK